MDDDAKQLLREIRDLLVRMEQDARKGNEQNLRTHRQQRLVIWILQGPGLP